MVMQALMDYIQQQLPDSCYINLIADGDARYLYEKFGFTDVAPASIGMAVMLQRDA
jgi:predicted N-acetyltransferase YhbS